MAAAAAEPTVTDANLVLGRLDADRFLGGEMQLDVERRDHRDARHASPIRWASRRHEAADGILRIAGHEDVATR